MRDVIGESLSARMTRSALALAALIVAYGYVKWFNKVGADFTDAQKSIGLAILAILIVSAFGLAINVLIVVPYHLWRRERDRYDALPSERKPFDVGLWDDVAVFKLFQVACLWVEVSPPHEATAIPISAAARLHILRRDVGNHVLPRYFAYEPEEKTAEFYLRNISLRMSSGQEASPETQIHRDDLMSYAISIKQNPKFLFKEIR